LCWVGVPCGIYQSSYNISYLKSPLHPSPLLFPSIPGIVSTGINFFLFTYSYTQYLYHIQLPTHFLHLLPPPIGTNPPRQDLFCPPVLWFCKRKEKMTFFFKATYTGSFLVALPCTYVLYPHLVHLVYFSSFYLNPFLMVVWTSLKILYAFLYREYINHIHLLPSLPSPLVCDLSLEWPVFHNIAIYVLGLWNI
jgi:hypothetical protein